MSSNPQNHQNPTPCPKQPLTCLRVWLWAVETGKQTLAQALVKEPDFDKDAALLHLPKINGHNLAFLQILLNAGANPNVSCAGKISVLMAYTLQGRTDAANILLAAGADASKTDAHGRTAAVLANLTTLPTTGELSC